MSSTDSLFIAHTPYHILISYAIAAEREERPHLFVRPTTTNYQALIDLFTSTDVFASHEVLAHPYDEYMEHRSNRYLKRTIRRNIRTIRSFMETTDVEAVFSALDEREIVQAAMHFAKDSGRAATGFHFEDGCFDYNPVVIEWIPYRSVLLNKIQHYLLFGFEWESPPYVRGTSEDISETYATFPAYVRPELQHLRQHRIRPDALFELGRRRELTDYLAGEGLATDELATVDAVVLVRLNRSGEVNTEYKALLNEAVERLESAGYTAGVKYHPRQTREDKMQLATGRDAVELPQEIPLELLFVSESSSIEVVVGGKSTAMKSALWLLDDPTVISVYPYLNERGLAYDDWDRSSLMEMFEDLGAILLTDVSQLETSL